MVLSKISAPACAAALLCLMPLLSHAQIALSLSDGKQKLISGVNMVTGTADRDSVTVLDFGVFPPKPITSLPLPTSLVGPPTGAAVSPDESIAVVTAAQKIDPADSKKTIPNNVVSVINLKTSPPSVIQTLEAGKGVSGASFSPDGRMLVVANRNEGTLSVFAVADGKLSKSDTVKIGAATSSPAHAAFTPDGKHLLVTRDGDMFVSVFDVADGKLSATTRDISTGIRPYGLAIAPNGSIAVVANIGRSRGDMDTISVIDLTRKPFRTVASYNVVTTPEAIALSRDGRWLAVASHNGSGGATDSPFFNAKGVLALFAVRGTTLVKQGDYPIGGWAQGLAFSADSSVLAVQNTVEQKMQFFKVGDNGLTDSGVSLPIPESAAGIRVSDFARR